MNTTVNGSSASTPLKSTAEIIGKTAAFCLFYVISLVGNSSIAFIVYKTKAMRKPVNYFIVNMAVSDLLFSTVLFPRLIMKLYVDSWPISGSAGEALCKLSYLLPTISIFVSVQSLVLMAVDRFGAVVFPLRSPLINSKLCFFFVLVTWVVAMAINSPYLFAFRLVEYREKLACKRRWNEAFGESSSEANYFLGRYVVLFYIPLVLITILYTIIVFKLKSQKFPSEQPAANAVEKRAKRNRNVLKLAIAIVLAFTVCWIPASILILLKFFEWGRHLPSGVSLYWYIALLMADANCAINPLICVIFSSNYRQGVKRLLNCFGVAWCKTSLPVELRAHNQEFQLT